MFAADAIDLAQGRATIDQIVSRNRVPISPIRGLRWKTWKRLAAAALRDASARHDGRQARWFGGFGGAMRGNLWDAQRTDNVSV